jgi:hypothetical protein
VRHRPFAPIDRARVLTVKRNNVAATAGGIGKVQVRERFPAATKTNDVETVLAAL